MTSITFIDSEIHPKSHTLQALGAVHTEKGYYHGTSLNEFTSFLMGSSFVCGHNIVHHDVKYLEKGIALAGIAPTHYIDTLYWSPLLFPKNPYHKLVKDDKLQIDHLNNPVNDAQKAKDLFYAEVAAFKALPSALQAIYYTLLNAIPEFEGFFRYLDFNVALPSLEESIRDYFRGLICDSAPLADFIKSHPVALAYSLALLDVISTDEKVHSLTPPWVLKNYPEVEHVLWLLRNTPCITGCEYCNEALDVYKGLYRWFHFEGFRTYGGEPLQENAVKAAVANRSLLAIFPTGGGKSITFQLPALMSGATTTGLTVVISPLQSLMKDQVDNLERQGITQAVTINGLLDPIEREKSFERVADGSATLLYISPESLRSKTIEKLLLDRKISRFVIDEAHCFSAWGQDFRVDYLYIGDFIKQLQSVKQLIEPIPVSCFTATAKQKVIEDIRLYFKEKLDLELELYTSSASRTNLHYAVYAKENDDEKYKRLRDLILEKNCPTIVYASRTKRVKTIADRLANDNIAALPFHGKMENSEKAHNQDSFIQGTTQVMVATSAFGMGVDKKDVGLVIHYDISDSLENYVQEAGRAGRDESLDAECFVLFNEEDLSKHFILLNQTKLSIKEIQQIWRAVKELTRFRSSVSNSALEIARKAGWDDSVQEIETRVKTAIAALEDAGYLKRGQNMPRVYANSILSKTVQEAIDKIEMATRFTEKQKIQAIRIIKKLISSKSRKQNLDEAAESRIDFISDHLGIVKEEVIQVINLLKEEGILADTKDLNAYIKSTDRKNTSLTLVERFAKLELFLVEQLETTQTHLQLKEINEKAELAGCVGVNPSKIKTLLNLWVIKHWIERSYLDVTKNHFNVRCLLEPDQIKEALKKRHLLAQFIVNHLYDNLLIDTSDTSRKEEFMVSFSVMELKTAYEESQDLFKIDIGASAIEDALFYLSRIEAIKIEGGFMVIHNKLTLERLVLENTKQYTKDDYKKLNQFYENKIQQIHIVGEYARKMIDNYQAALQFVDDYFQLNYPSFLRKYFPGSRVDELKLKMTPSKFKQLFGDLSPTQLKIINDNESKNIVVTAGPGSGKTRILVHKLASLLLMEDVKHEQLLMLTFSRAAATEFKKRLQALIGNAAHFIEIKTFHSYCFDLLGKVGTLEKSQSIIERTVNAIRNNEVERNRITKTVLVIDEAQDMNRHEFELIQVLMGQNEDMRVIAVGDDDQNIYEFRGSDSAHFASLISRYQAIQFDLLENYRSKKNLVDFSNTFVQRLKHRLKQEPILAHQKDIGKLELITYQSPHLIQPLVDRLCQTDLVGTTAVLTKTNEEALQVLSLLKRHRVPAKLIQTSSSFRLYDLEEVRFFINALNIEKDTYAFTDSIWNDAKEQLKIQFANSRHLEHCLALIEEFEKTVYKVKYKTDFLSFIEESQLEDFIHFGMDDVVVSTIHKSKGREFDTVFLLLEQHPQFDMSQDSRLRELYVGLTRAKTNLYIHTNESYFPSTSVEGMQYKTDTTSYTSSSKIIIQMTHKDIYLDYFIDRQDRVAQCISGKILQVTSEGCVLGDERMVVKFSSEFKRTIEKYQLRGYVLKGAAVQHIVYWQKEDYPEEIKIVLPVVYLGKSN